jgi:hypothetical protein
MVSVLNISLESVWTGAANRGSPLFFRVRLDVAALKLDHEYVERASLDPIRNSVVREGMAWSKRAALVIVSACGLHQSESQCERPWKRML